MNQLAPLSREPNSEPLSPITPSDTPSSEDSIKRIMKHYEEFREGLKSKVVTKNKLLSKKKLTAKDLDPFAEKPKIIAPF